MAKKKKKRYAPDDPKAPWNLVDEDGFGPGDYCCLRSCGRYCYEHNMYNYPDQILEEEEKIQIKEPIYLKLQGECVIATSKNGKSAILIAKIKSPVTIKRGKANWVRIQEMYDEFSDS